MNVWCHGICRNIRTYAIKYPNTTHPRTKAGLGNQIFQMASILAIVYITTTNLEVTGLTKCDLIKTYGLQESFLPRRATEQTYTQNRATLHNDSSTGIQGNIQTRLNMTDSEYYKSRPRGKEKLSYTQVNVTLFTESTIDKNGPILKDNIENFQQQNKNLMKEIKNIRDYINPSHEDNTHNSTLNTSLVVDKGGNAVKMSPSLLSQELSLQVPYIRTYWENTFSNQTVCIPDELPMFPDKWRLLASMISKLKVDSY